jgi:diphosphomevalonate decarboxylase
MSVVYAVAKLWNLDDDMEFLSSIARQGSGSACRSLFGGWVRWTMGQRDDGSDSTASQVADHLHWPDMRVLVLVVSDRRKEMPSTDGMQRTVASCPMIPVCQIATRCTLQCHRRSLALYRCTGTHSSSS